MPKDRNQYWDIMKGLAIILVIIGHCIQIYSGTEYFNSKQFYENHVFKFIYSFHMPLFMMICGYFFYASSKKRSFTELVKTKLCSILIPILSFSFVSFVLSHNSEIIFTNFIENIKSYLFFTRFNLWFLWTVLKLSILVALIQKHLKDNWVVYIFVFILTFLIPDGGWTQFSALDKFMYPYFVLGYYSNKHHLFDHSKSYSYHLLFTVGIIHMISLCFYSTETYVYQSGTTLWQHSDPIHQLIIDTHRLLSGLSGSIFLMIFVKIILMKTLSKSVNNIISFIGINSMGIYCIHQNILPIKYLTSSYIGPNIILTPIEASIIISVSLLLTWLLSRNTITKILFLGGR